MSARAKLPMRVQQAGAHLVVRLIDPERLDWTAPFFRNAVPASSDAHAMEVFDAWQGRQPSCDPDYSDLGLIFHVSRCGSTLLARNVAATRQAIVLSEPPFFSALHGRYAAIPMQEDALRISLLLLEPWRRWAKGQGKRLVLKLSSQLNPFMQILREAMQGAHCVALHRAPLPVLESLDRKRMLRLQEEAVSIRPGLMDALGQLDDDPYLIAAANRYITSLEAMELARGAARIIGYEDLAARYPQVLASLGLSSAAAPEWSGTINAKAQGKGIHTPYLPVSPDQLARFKDAHLPLLALAEARYQRFCAGLTTLAPNSAIIQDNP